MVEALVLKAEKRASHGTRASRKERKAGNVPAIVYGHKAEPISVTLNYHDFALEMQHHHRLLDVELEGKQEKLLIKEVQYDHLGDKIIHVDLTRVDLTERVQMTVRLEFRGTPAGLAEGGVLHQMSADIELECLVTNIPESIRVNIAEMQPGDMLLAKNIELPEGTSLATAPETPVVAVRLAVEAPEEEEEEGTSGEAEPEIITAREKPEDEESKS